MKKEDIVLFGGLTAICIIVLFCAAILNPIHKNSIEQLSQPSLITCRQCKGSGEYPTDINKLMMEASITLFVNKHLMVDRCKDCVKLPNNKGYKYCEIVDKQYQTLVKEYEAAGPKIDMAACDKCMGMGRFTCQKKDGSYMTQEEYDRKNK